MGSLFNPNALGGSFALQTARPLEWLFVFGGALLYVAGIAFLYTRGARQRTGGLRGVFDRIDAGAQETTGVTAWAAEGALTGIWALLVAFVGFVWDVAWHADTGRDRELFTVPHTLIFVGLGGIVLAAVVATWAATRTRADTGWRLGRWRVPYSAVPLGVIGMGALLGFPLDDYWHASYGIDVTMWSPTHLMMIGGASLSPLALWLMLAEAGAARTAAKGWLWTGMGGVVLVGLSTFQLEYDMGIPQWQAFYHPMLVAGAMAIALVAARTAFGPGGAVKAAVGFLVMRGLMALLVGVLLGHSLPRFPLYLGGAAGVEAAFWLLSRRSLLWRALASGALVATLGLAIEWAWTHLWFQYPWQPSLLPFAWMFVAMAVAGALVGVAAGAILRGNRAPVPGAAVAIALLAVFGLLALNVGSRAAEPGTMTVATTTVGTATPLVNRDGVRTLSRNVTLEVRLQPAGLADGADWFEALAWQGGPPVKHFRLIPSGPGLYRADGLIPTGGNWKSLVILHKGNFVEGAAIAMPADPAYNLPAIDPPDSRTTSLQPTSKFLMREFRPENALPAIIISVLFVIVVGAWVVTTSLAYRTLGRGAEPPAGRAGARRSRPQPRRVPAAG